MVEITIIVVYHLLRGTAREEALEMVRRLVGIIGECKLLKVSNKVHKITVT